MDTRTTIPISEARRRIFEIVDKIQKRGSHYTITEKGRPKAVIMSAEEFESWQETLEVQKMFPNLDKDIKQAREDYKKGNYVTLEEILKKEGYILADKSKTKYEVSNRSAKKNKKKTR
ncbi:MAG: type II toxin-antitoxin system Phd/YefM family antitoxin [Candidatus Nealsonbacteria bacterium]